jgi:hypothetical protein
MQQFQKDVHAVWLPAGGDEAMATDGSRLIRFSLRDGEASGSNDLGIKSARLASFGRSGKRLVIADSNTLHLVDLTQVTSHRSIKLPRGEMAYSLKFHPQENWVAVGMRAKISYQKSLDFSSDGRLLATASDSARDSIKIFRLANVTP